MITENTRSAQPEVLTIGDVALDINAHVLSRSGKAVRLNRKEFALLHYLMQNAGMTLTRAMILERVWDTNSDPFTNTVDVHVRYLRRKLGDGASKIIVTVHGYGYKFATP